MNSITSIDRAVQGAHTVFLVTNYWQSMSKEVEFAQGKNVADAAKMAAVSHMIFSSLIHVTKATSGRLAHVPHFDGKAEVEEYIREIGLPATFVLPGYFMSNFRNILRKGDDGQYTLAFPISNAAQFPLFDANDDTGKFNTTQKPPLSLMQLSFCAGTQCS
jgi:uncharacterized protein YbjT (DUF2867 family)